jgi:catechol 2,3-dioxygenase-like lactoylglutathione lyase family enzyme
VASSVDPEIVAPIGALFVDLAPGEVKAIARPVPLVRPSSLAWLRFEKPDLGRQARFLRDFGLEVVEHSAADLYARGADGASFCYHARKGARSRFIGVGLTLDTREDLERIEALPGASPIRHEIGPGGGDYVTLHDPNGFAVDFVHGRTPSVLREEAISAIPSNTAHGYQRLNQQARPPLQPARVIGLGHVVIQCTDFDATLDWWMRHAGLIPSDVQVLSDGSPNLAFCRLDRGELPADHHAIAIAGGIGALYMHSAFEVVDLDAVGQGQQVLKAAGWKHGWGVGRHYYGSQIFDYWRDPDGMLMEHYTDGDRYDAAMPTRYSRFSRGSTWMWGQDQPRDFEGVSLGAIALMVRNLMTGRLRWRRLRLVLAAVKAAPRPWLK